MLKWLRKLVDKFKTNREYKRKLKKLKEKDPFIYE
jgi:hypothetical protein